ncbi:DUF4381 family protein [Frateuria aurantia]
MQLLPSTASAAPVAPAMQPATQGTLPASAAGPVLRDIHMPADPSWWPPAPGWWVLAAAVLVLLVAALLIQKRQQRKRRWRASVLVELDQAELQFRKDADRSRLSGTLHALLRRAAAALDASALSARGKEWEAVLDRIKLDEATRSRLLALDQSMYQRAGGEGFDPDQSIAAVRSWMTLALRRLAAEHASRHRRAS